MCGIEKPLLPMHLSRLEEETSILPTSDDEAAIIDSALLELVEALANDDLDKEFDEKSIKFDSDSAAAAMARFLDDRICVPRDMGAIPAGYLKVLANTKKADDE